MMKRFSSRQRVALMIAVVACVLTLCAVAHAAPLHLDRWTSLLGQRTSGSFGGSAWGSGGSSSSGSGGSSGDGIVGAILGILLQLLFELLVRVFWYCLTTYPFPTVATLAIGVLFWVSRWQEAPAAKWLVPEAATRGPEFAAADEAVFKRLSRAMKWTSGAGLALAGALVLGGLGAAAVWVTRSVMTAIAALLVAMLGAVVGLASHQTRASAASMARVFETQGSDMDHVADAVKQLLPSFRSLGIVLGVTSGVLGVMVIAAFAAGGPR